MAQWLADPVEQPQALRAMGGDDRLGLAVEQAGQDGMAARRQVARAGSGASSIRGSARMLARIRSNGPRAPDRRMAIAFGQHDGDAPARRR